MPIVIKETPEPLTYAAQTTEPILASCDAYRALVHDIQRYGKRETMGRSLLISGHRGAGKTTLVRWAIQMAQKELGKNNGTVRPLLVALHGPDLLGGEAVLSFGKTSVPIQTPPKGKTKAEGDSTTPDSQGDAGKKTDQPADTLPAKAQTSDKSAEEFNQNTRAALQMLTQALHRAYVNELGRAFNERVKDREEMRELAAQLLVELDHVPTLDSLRFAWNAAGKLEAGVLFSERDQGQGFRELVAASIAIEAFQRVAGKLEGSQGSAEQSELLQKLERKSDLSGKDLFNPLVGLLGGGAAGAAVIASGAASSIKPVLAALASVITAVASTTVLNYSSSRSLKRTRESKATFTWDTSIASLDRMLPVMVEKIVEAGLAPIFVVDELDKVPDIESKMENLIRHLKHLVTEKTFFCFLADRRYFEHVVATSRSTVYGKEYTFFSDRLFVHYRPEDLHSYLDAIFDKDKIANENERDDLLVLPFLLLGRAKMHPIDLRRALYDIADANAVIDIPVGEIRAPGGYVMTIFMQAAVELVLHDKDLRSRLHQDPNFFRLAYDTLYLAARSWEKGEDTLILTRKHLQKKLEDRMASDGDVKEMRGNLNASDLDLLYGSLRRLAAFLHDPSLFIGELSVKQQSSEPVDARFKDDGWNAVRRLVGPDVQILGDITNQETAAWLCDQFGRKRVDQIAPPSDSRQKPAKKISEAVERIAMTVETPNAAPVKETSKTPIMERIQQIRQLDSLLRSITVDRINLDRLASQIQLLGLSPAWPSVESAMRTCEFASGAMATDVAVQSAESIIESYARLLETYLPAIRRALILSALLAAIMPGSDYARRFDAALRMLASDLRFGKVDIAKTLEVLKGYDLPVITFAETLSLPLDMRLFENSALDAWVERFEKLGNTIPSASMFTPPSQSEMAAHLERWRVFFFRRFRTGESTFIPSLEDLILRIKRMALPMETNLEEMTYLKYAEVISYLNPPFPDPWLMPAILIELGFAKEVAARYTSEKIITKVTIEIIEICNLPQVQKNGEKVLLVIGGSQGKYITSDEGDKLEVEKRGSGSVTTNWRISQQHAVFPVFRADTLRILSPETEFAPTMVLFEEQPSIVFSKPWPFVRALKYKLLPLDASEKQPSGLVAPSDLDEAVALAKKQAGGPASA